jgi:hypothetical protein
MTFDRRAAKLEEIFSASTEADASAEAARRRRVIEFLDILEERRRLEFSRPKSSSAAELLELAIARHFEKQGRTAQEISELLPACAERFGHLERQFAEARASSATQRFGRQG